jgi:hypothetical protein
MKWIKTKNRLPENDGRYLCWAKGWWAVQIMHFVTDCGEDCWYYYMYGFVAIQGLIERTPIFGNYFKDKVNLLKIGGFTEKEINLIRDAEPDMWISDGKLSWYDFITKNRAAITGGTRVVLTRSVRISDKDEAFRVAPFITWNSPPRDNIYIVKISKSSYYGSKFVIYYSPGDEIWDEYEGGYRERKRRIPYRLYSDEIMNYDTITVEECEYYETNRYERKNYLDILPTIHWVKQLKQKEKELEEHFIRFIQPHLKRKVSDTEIKKAIRWWKLKNKWKRDLLTDDAKAIRMILRTLNKEKTAK